MSTPVETLVDSCALASATDVAMKAWALYHYGDTDYDVEDDVEELRDGLGVVVDALFALGWLDVAAIEAASFPEG